MPELTAELNLSPEQESALKTDYKKAIVVFAGLPGTGKSTLAQLLSQQSNMTLLDVDEARKELGLKSMWQSGPLEKEAMEQAYRYNHLKAQQLLAQGKPVALTATYSREYYHQLLQQLAETTQAPLHIFLLQTPEEHIAERLSTRTSDSNITQMQAFQEVKNRFTPPQLQGTPLTVITTTNELEKEQQLGEIKQALTYLEEQVA